jgi:hypothetical protein
MPICYEILTKQSVLPHTFVTVLFIYDPPCYAPKILQNSSNDKQSRTEAGHAVAQLVEELRYRPEGRGFDFRWRHRNFSSTQSFRPYYGPGVDILLTVYHYVSQ